MPEHLAAGGRGEIHLLGETLTVLFIRQDIHRERQPTPGEDCHETVVAERTDEAVERHGREMIEHCAQLQTEPPVGRQQRITGDVWSHRARTSDAVREDREDRCTPCTLDAPDREPTQPDAYIMRVAREAPATTTGRFVCELKAGGEEESAHEFNKGLAVAQQLEVGCFVSKIDRDGAVVAGPFGCCAHVVSPPGHQVSSVDETRWGSHIEISRLS
jgi:hypothetical protein